MRKTTYCVQEAMAQNDQSGSTMSGLETDERETAESPTPNDGKGDSEAAKLANTMSETLSIQPHPPNIPITVDAESPSEQVANGHQHTVDEVPQDAANNNIPTNHSMSEVVEPASSDRVIWTPKPGKARQRSVSPQRVRSRRQDSTAHTGTNSSGPDKIVFYPIGQLGRLRPTSQVTVRARSSSAVRSVNQWRSAGVGEDDDDEAADQINEDADVVEIVEDLGAGANANPGGGVGPRFGKHGQRTLLEQQKVREKRAKDRASKKARKTAVQTAGNLANSLKGVKLQLVVEKDVGLESRKRPTNQDAADSTVAKKSKLENTMLAKKLADYLAAGEFQMSSNGPRSLKFFSHGPISISDLRQYAHTLRDMLQGTGEEALAHPTDVLRDATGLLTLQLDDLDQSTVHQVAVSRADRARVQVTPGYTFFSSELLSLASKVEFGANYKCATCRQPHWPVARSKTILVTYSEVVAASGFPSSLTLPGAPQQEVSPTSAGECYDVVWVLGGLMSDPAKILKAIYGSFMGDLLIFLHLGTWAISQGESSHSVRDRLYTLVRNLRSNLRHPGKGNLRLVVLPPIIHLGEGELVLHQGPPRPLSKCALAELLDLRKLIDCHNGALTEVPFTPMQAWAMLVSSRQDTVATDSLNRTYREVSVVVKPVTLAGNNGELHLQPAAIHNMVRSLAAFMGTHSVATW